MPPGKKGEGFIEIGTVLQLTVEGVNAVFKSIFVGAKANEYIVTTPLSPDHPPIETLSKETKITARYIHQNNMFLFQTRFINSISTPVPLILWTFPVTINNTQQRGQKRVNCLLPGKIEFDTAKKGEKVTGVIKDISKSACRFQLKVSDPYKDQLCVGKEILVRCNFPGISGEQQSVGKVVGVSESDEEVIVRIQFSHIQWWVPPYSV